MSDAPTSENSAGALVRAAAATLSAAGVENAAGEARQLLAYVLDVGVGALVLDPPVGRDEADRFTELITRRAERVPLQHLTGVTGFRHLLLRVGPGVFVPRPETEAMAGWAIDWLHGQQAAERSEGRPCRVVDLCTGSGAVAAAIDDEVPGCEIAAVEISESAADYAALNLAGRGVRLEVGDIADVEQLWPDLVGRVDLVSANPPYIPLEAWESVAVEARDHDPGEALFSGADGLDAIRTVARVAARLLRPGGVLCCEHAEVQADSAPAVFSATGLYADVRDHRDLTGRPRFVTARRIGTDHARV